jgi:hypothetical protein
MEKRSKAVSPLRLITMALAVVAIVKELRTPSSQRTWHGTVAGFVPYDFRLPTIQRLRDTYWNPGGPLVTGQAFGVGWAVNLAAVKQFFTR